jgi:hypothetical protein
LVKLGYTATCRTGTRRRAAPVRPRAPRAVPLPWRPGRTPAEAARLPKASSTQRLPLRSAPPRGASSFDDRALARDHRSVRRSLHCASTPTKEVTVLCLTPAWPRRGDRRGEAPCYKTVSAMLLLAAHHILPGQRQASSSPQADGDQAALEPRPDSLGPLSRLLAHRSKPLSRPSTARGGHRRRSPVHPLAGPLPAPTERTNRPPGTGRPSPTHARPPMAAGWPDFGRSRVGHRPGTTLKAPKFLQGLNREPRVDL